VKTQFVVSAAVVCSLWANGRMSGASCSGVIHQLDFSPQYSDLVLSLPMGVAVVATPEPDVYALASAYRAALNSQSSPPQGKGKRSIIAAGPLLDSPDDVQIRDCRREGDKITLRVVHTSVRLRGASLRRNLPFRPLVDLAISEAGRYVVEVEWQALETLPAGRPIGEPILVGPIGLTL